MKAFFVRYGAAAAVIAVAAAAGIAFYSSLWLLWFSLPAQTEHTVQFALDVKALEGSALANTAVKRLPALALVAPLLPSAKRLAYSSEPEKYQLVALEPRFWRYRSTAAFLRNSGWHTRYAGIWLIGYRGSPPDNPPFKQSLRIAVKQWANGTARYPSSVSYLPHLFTRPFQIITTTTHNRTIVILAAGQSPVTAAGSAVAEPSSDVFDVTFPGDLFTQFDQGRAWQHLMRQKLGFVKTNPAIFEDVSQYEFVRVVLQGEELGIAASGHASLFEQVAIRWLEAEDQAGRTSQRAFRLPDGSRGYELIPGEVRPVVAPYVSEPVPSREVSCAASVSHLKLWICRSDTNAALATTREIAALLAAAAPQLRIAIGERWLRSTEEVSLKAVFGWIGEEGGRIEFTEPAT